MALKSEKEKAFWRKTNFWGEVVFHLPVVGTLLLRGRGKVV